MPPAHGGRARRPAAVRTTARRAAGPEVSDRRSRCVPPPYPPLHLGMDGMGRQFSPIMMGDSLRLHRRLAVGLAARAATTRFPRDLCPQTPRISRVLGGCYFSSASLPQGALLAGTHPPTRQCAMSHVCSWPLLSSALVLSGGYYVLLCTSTESRVGVRVWTAASCVHPWFASTPSLHACVRSGVLGPQLLLADKK